MLFNDMHVDFEKFSFCGINEDNIYTPQNGSAPVENGISVTTYTSRPYEFARDGDSFLMNEIN